MTAIAEAPDPTSLWHPPTVAKREAEAARLVASGLKNLVEAEPYMKRFAVLDDDRKPIEPKWREVRQFLMPSAGRYLDGDELSGNPENFILDMSSIRDASPIKMALTAADGLQSGLSGQATQWFSYYVGSYEDFKEQVSSDVKLWVRNAQECVRDVLGASNFYEEIHQVYLEAICFGTAAMLILSDPISKARYYAATVGSYWLGQNARREVDTMYLRTTYRASDLVRIYGKENCPDEVNDAIGAGFADRCFNVMQCIQPWNHFGNMGRHPEYLFEDVRFVEGCKANQKVLYRGGYRTKPFVVVRWGAAGGRLYANNCPGFLAIPDVKQLQAETRDYNMGNQWTSNPAWAVAAAQAKNVKGIRPGGIYEIPGGDPRAAALVPLITPAFNFAESNNSRARLLDRISAHLYNREILLIQSRGGQSITATEVNELKAEKNAVLGPITVRMGTNALIPTLDRTFEIITVEWHVLAPAPPEIAGKKIQPYFTSDLAKAQRQADIIMAAQVVNQVAAIQPMYPAIVHTLNFDAIIRLYEKTDALPAECFNSPQVVQERLAADAKAQQAQAQQMQQAQAIDMMQKLGNTGVGPDTALGRVADREGEQP